MSELWPVQHGVPVFTDIKSATEYAIKLAKSSKVGLTLTDVKAVIADIRFKHYLFSVSSAEDDFYLQLHCDEIDIHSGNPSIQQGRQWHISRSASPSQIVQTAFKAVITWVEHDAREHFLYKGEQVFGPHFDIDRLVDLCKSPDFNQASEQEE